MLEINHREMNRLIGEVCQYLDLYDNLIITNNIEVQQEADYRFERIDYMLSDLMNSMGTTQENEIIFHFCADSLCTLQYLKNLGLVERWIESFQATVLDISMLSNLDRGHKNIIHWIYLSKLS